MRLRPCLLAIVLCLLAPVATAAAASPSGTLAQLAGAGGCASAQTALGCTPARGLDDARAVALSPDGLSLYVAAATPASVTTFSVAPGNGLLQQLNLGAGCLASVAQDGCGGARALEGASAIVVSPDNLHVYAASATAGSVSTFIRQPNGSLVQPAGVAGCLSTTPAAGCSSEVRSLGGADALAISPDGHFVYAAGGTADSLLVFSRDAATGRLTQLAGTAGCLRNGRSDCAPVTGLDGPAAIAMAPDGTSLYVASAVGTVTAFQRDVTTGTLAQLPAGAGCLSDGDLAGCTAVGGLARASAVAFTPDGRTLIAAGTDDDAVVSFRRDPAGGALTRASCVSASAGTAGCTLSPLIGGPRALVVRSNGLSVWVAASRADSIVTLQIDPTTGALTPSAGLGGCLRRLASSDCRAARGLDDPRGLAASADGAHVYAVSAQSDAIAVLGPQLAPNCLRVRATTVANKAHSVVLACSDPNGDAITLQIGKPPLHGRVTGLVKSTGSITYTPLPGYTGADSITYTATDGLDVSAPGTATVSVTLPPKAPVVRIRTGRTHLLQGGHIHVLVECPPIAIGPCRVAAHLLVRGTSRGYGFSRIKPRTTGRVVLRASGVKGRTQAQVVVTVRDKSRRATVVKRTILILP
ncbi:MAG TPA: beta-propeller fold lactonase family protein [Gaiellales bacterium]|jgi:6-phosphogluconolactonase (cycloisomerase 2 family)|nr:beta-propeller fold lactonase family protein [Gaiellales bacterium]